MKAERLFSLSPLRYAPFQKAEQPQLVMYRHFFTSENKQFLYRSVMHTVAALPSYKNATNSGLKNKNKGIVEGLCSEFSDSLKVFGFKKR